MITDVLFPLDRREGWSAVSGTTGVSTQAVGLQAYMLNSSSKLHAKGTGQAMNKSISSVNANQDQRVIGMHTAALLPPTPTSPHFPAPLQLVVVGGPGCEMSSKLGSFSESQLLIISFGLHNSR